MMQRVVMWAAVVSLATDARAEDKEEWNAEVSVGNRYVTEGISHVPDADALLFSDLAVTWRGISVGAAYVQALNGDSYNEVNLYAEHGFEIGAWRPYVGINYLTYPAPDDADSWEVYAGFEWDGMPFLTWFAEAFYDFDDVKGGFVEIGVAAEVPHPVPALTLSPYVSFGADFGYYSGTRTLTENHAQVGLNLTLDIRDGVSLIGGLHHSFALTNLDRLGEGDVTWATVGVSVSF